MNLQEFLDFRKYCPVCSTQLVTSFHSHRKQAIRLQNNRLEVIFKVAPLTRSSTDFKAGYAFDFTTPNFSVEFYDKSDIHQYDQVHKFYIDRFMEMHKNLRKFRFYRDCTYCSQYAYVSTNIELDFRTATISEIKLGWEELCVSKDLEDTFQIYRIFNLHNYDNAVGRQPYTHLSVCKSDFNRKSIRLDMPAESLHIDLPLVPITEPEEMVERFSKLLVFA